MAAITTDHQQPPLPPLGLERSLSQHSCSSARSHRSTLRSGRTRRLHSQASTSSRSSSSIAASDKSLTSFPSFGAPEGSAAGIPSNDDADERLKTATQESENRRFRATLPARPSIVDSLIDTEASNPVAATSSPFRGALFEDGVLTRSVPGALHQAPDGHIERLVARQGAVSLVRQLAQDLAQRDTQMASLRRRADERERALRRIIRECGLSTMELEARLRVVEAEMRTNGLCGNGSSHDGGLTDLMSDAMQDTVSENVYGETDLSNSTVRLGSATVSPATGAAGKSTLRGLKDMIWGSGTAKRSSRGSSVNGDAAAALRSHSSLERRPAIQDDLFDPPDARSVRSSSRASSIYSGASESRKVPASLASLALKLVAGGTQTESRGRAVSTTGTASARGASAASRKGAPSGRSASVTGPKALMAMRRATPGPTSQPSSSRAQAQELWGGMAGSPPKSAAARQESYGPVEMDAILPPESQPPTLTQMYNYSGNSSHLTDRFGFIYDQRRKKRQREAQQTSQRVRKGSRAEMLLNGRSSISPNLLDDLPSPKWSESDGRPGTPGSMEDKSQEEGKPKRWQDYLSIATFPTELLSHTPSISASALEVLEAAEMSRESEQQANEPTRPQAIRPTGAGLVPPASTTTTAVDNETTPSSEPESAASVAVQDDNEPVKLLLQQLSEVHDSLQREKTVRWNDFLRKVRAERKREGEAAIAAANAVAEARYERPTMILPETRVADGEVIGIAGLGIKGKVGRAKWNEFKTLVLGGIPVAYRAKVWSECSGATALRVPGYYDDIVAQSGELDDPTVVSQIQMDIHRTLTDNIFFREGPGVSKLSEVLLAYSRRNKDVGYCQGMNLITANLLLITPSAEDAFWILASIVENILPHGYYDHSLIASRADQQVLRQYVATVLPKLSAHLDALSIELEALTFQWFLSVFTDCLSAEALFRTWDVVLCTQDGSTFLFQVALALLKLNERNLLRRDTAAGVYTYINHHMTEHATSIDGLLQASEALRRVVRRDDVEERRAKAIQAERDLIAQRTGSQGGSARSRVAGDEAGSVNSGASLTMEEPRPME
ncbi:Rab-GAP/TBC domain protein [Cordyceps fumosorosea ARSEF 2679]|uniref:Rab-GAP/TBC domain protein n=1 Tax=Cordyceps fumosorosea (strain ARSEF 2679) TaxID=1081104 RepID=A0A168BAM8_CORFA|nr:Rab-GAP/TBC domain protein [Cordyceps fumosorosea ARSEF 2679]OAA69855.1 Rab-GAP/TBC domain protein [Cordyceps fumosorosea ARSEF 2679]